MRLADNANGYTVANSYVTAILLLIKLVPSRRTAESFDGAAGQRWFLCSIFSGIKPKIMRP